MKLVILTYVKKGDAHLVPRCTASVGATLKVMPFDECQHFVIDDEENRGKCKILDIGIREHCEDADWVYLLDARDELNPGEWVSRDLERALKDESVKALLGEPQGYSPGNLSIHFLQDHQDVNIGFFRPGHISTDPDGRPYVTVKDGQFIMAHPVAFSILHRETA